MEPIPPGRMLSQQGQMGEDLGPARDYMTDYENPTLKALPSLGSRKKMEWHGALGGLGIRGRRERKETESNIYIILHTYQCFCCSFVTHKYI